MPQLLRTLSFEKELSNATLVDLLLDVGDPRSTVTLRLRKARRRLFIISTCASEGRPAIIESAGGLVCMLALDDLIYVVIEKGPSRKGHEGGKATALRRSLGRSFHRGIVPISERRRWYQNRQFSAIGGLNLHRRIADICDRFGTTLFRQAVQISRHLLDGRYSPFLPVELWG